MAKTNSRINGRGLAATVRPATKNPRKPAAQRPATQRLALLVGGVGTFVLMLSVWECTMALHALTGMPYVLAGLLAVGIDLGMVASEAAAVASPKGSEALWWAERYIYVAVGLSVLLNAAAAASHVDGWLRLPALLIGGVVPVLVYIAGRVAGALWTGK